jgi:hypothetical protein
LNPIAQRVAQNDATFREANERIERVAEDAGVELVPFICECADERCTDLVTLSLDQYEHVRRDSKLFLNVPGHEASAMGWAEVVERHEGFVVVAKVGEAAELAEDLDARQASE